MSLLTLLSFDYPLNLEFSTSWPSMGIVLCLQLQAAVEKKTYKSLNYFYLTCIDIFSLPLFPKQYSISAIYIIYCIR